MRVDPFIIPLPEQFQKDPAVLAYMQYLERFLRDLRLRTGGASDDVHTADISGGSVTGLTTFGLRSSGTGAFDLRLTNTETLTADRTLTVTLNDADRTLTLGGALTLAGNFITSGANALTLTTTGATTVTLPTSGTLATLAGTEEFANKTLNASVLKGVFTASGTVTLPALTLGGAIAGGGQNIDGLGTLNKVTVTAPAAGATLALADGSTLATSGAYSVTFTATGATNVTMPTTGTLATLAGIETLSNKTFSTNIVSTSSGAVISNTVTGTGVRYFVLSNTAGRTYYGTERSTGGAVVPGTSAYSSVFGSDLNVDVHIVANNGVVATFNSTGAAVTGKVTATTTLGYATGAGGTVTQATSKSTGVTLNKASGQITTHNATLNAGAAVGFTVTNSTVAATDTVRVCIASGATADSYYVTVDAVAAGSFRISLANRSASNLSEALALNFAVIKGVTS